MSDVGIDVSTPSRSRVTRRAKERPWIALASGDSLVPRCQWAEAKGISDKTAARMNLPTTYISNVAYVLDGASTEILAERVQRRNQPSTGRRRGAR
jgi:hypothetical protein